MRNIAFIFLLIASILPLNAQEPITGLIYEQATKSPLTNVLVTLKSKSNQRVVRYTQTNDKGYFSILVKEDDYTNCTLHVSMIGFKPQSITLNKTKKEYKLFLQDEITQLREVTVKSKKIREQGDTLVYNVASFKDVQDKSIGDVLQKMPGIDVSKSGQISYNGVQINKFYIEGADLLEGKYGIATTGISPADVGSVEVLENHQPVKALSGVALSDQTAINLHLKEKAKAKWIVNLLGAGGLSSSSQGGLWLAEGYAMRFKREATLTITCGSNSKTIKVVQVQKDAVVVAKNNYEFDCDAYPLTFQVNTNVNFQTTTDADWIKPYATTRALVTKEVSFAIDRNDAAVAREGYIIFQYGELMQKVRISQTAFETKMNITLVHSESTLDAPELMGDKASAVVDWGDGYTEDYSEYLKHTYTDGQASHNTVVKARSTNQVVLQSIGSISSLVIEYDE